MNTSDFRIALIDDCGDNTCYFYDDRKNQYYDGEYTGDYYEGDRVLVTWDCLDGINRVAYGV